MQLSEFSQNKNNLLNHITRLIKKFNTLTANIDLQNLSKGKWKCTVVKHIVKYANNYCVKKIKNLSKLRYIFKNKQELMKEKYMCKLSRSAASEIFKQRARMFHFKKISETSINAIFYAYDVKKNKMWKNIYLESAKN